MTESQMTIRLLFADRGAFHHEDLVVPASVLEEYDRLIDGLREDPAVLKKLYLDLDRVAAAWLKED